MKHYSIAGWEASTSCWPTIKAFSVREPAEGRATRADAAADCSGAIDAG